MLLTAFLVGTMAGTIIGFMACAILTMSSNMEDEVAAPAPETKERGAA
jgi:hypothetical protein